MTFYPFRCLSISRSSDGACRSFPGDDQEDFWGRAVAADPLFGVLWAYDADKAALKSYSNALAEIDKAPDASTILSPELALPRYYLKLFLFEKVRSANRDRLAEEEVCLEPLHLQTPLSLFDISNHMS